jgi:transposase
VGNAHRGDTSERPLGRLNDVEQLRTELTRRERELRRENRRQKRQIDGLQRDKGDLQRQVEHLRRENERLRRELAAAQRAGRRQAAPFAKDRPQGRGRRPGRRAGADYGRQGRRRRPTHVDETHAAPVPAACPDCGGAVASSHVASQYQEELPTIEPIVRHFEVEVGYCTQCQRRVQGRHRLQTSDALGAAGAQLGPNVATLVVELHTELGMPLGKVARVLGTQFGLSVTEGGLVHLLHRTAAAAAPAYAALREQIRRSPLVTPDETGWRINAVRHWLWAFTTRETTEPLAEPRGRGGFLVR